MSKSALIGSNAVIREITKRHCLVRRASLKVGTVYCYADNLNLIRAEVAERLIGKGVLKPVDSAPDHFSLSEAWS